MAETGTLRGELSRAPQWVWIVIAVGAVIVMAGIISSALKANAPYSATQEFGGLKSTIDGPSLSGGTLVIPLTIRNLSSDERYDYDAGKSFSVNFTARGKVYPSSVDGTAVGTLAPKEERVLKLRYTVADGQCPNNLHFEAQGSLSSGDIAIKGLGCD